MLQFQEESINTCQVPSAWKKWPV